MEVSQWLLLPDCRPELWLVDETAEPLECCFVLQLSTCEAVHFWHPATLD